MSSGRSSSISTLPQSFAAPSTRRAETLGKAVELFSQRGFSQVGLRELAAHVGINAGSIYHHIDSKETLLFELIETLYLDLLDIVTRSKALKKPNTGEQRLRHLVMAHLELHLKKKDYFHVAEHDFRCLSPAHQHSILLLRERYEDHFHSMLLTMNIVSNENTVRCTARSLVRLLNNLPFWFTNTTMGPSARHSFLARMVMAAARAALVD